MSATTDYLERQSAALLELIEKKDAYITRLQDEVSQKSSYAFTVKAERQNMINTLKEYVIDAVKMDDISASVAESIAEICDFELTKTITITSTVDFEIEVEVPFDTDADDVIASLEYSVDAFDYSIDDFSLDTRNVDWSDNIS
jgi:sugar-specific transcriptional regulator TrmB